MLFTQIEFALFFLIVALFCGVVRNHRLKKVFLLAASYYFYAYWDWRFAGLLLLSSGVDYAVGFGLKRARRDRTRKALVTLSIVTNLGVLFVFKYLNFLIGPLTVALAPLGFHLETLNLILPVGISFFTFQKLSYTVDVYRRNLEPCGSFIDFALFAAFFPQLVAGPIVRAADFLPQLQQPRTMTWHRTFLGARQFILGLFKKVIIADGVSGFVDNVFAHAGAFDCTTTWLSVLAYTAQIYCDFSGYSDMAIGAARVLGYDLCRNFSHPYLATSLSDFWRRWHISLSTWLRDYLYVSLGGNRKGKYRTYANLILTMLLGGLWHGAAWTFAAWGLLHGLGLAVSRRSTEKNGQPKPTRGNRRSRVLGWIGTMLLVVIGWVVFRSQSFAAAGAMLRQMFLPASGMTWVPVFPILAVSIVAAGHMYSAMGYDLDRTLKPLAWYTPAFLFFLVWLVIVFYPKGFRPFIYFQF